MRGFLSFTMLVSVLGVYLFVSAPPPLVEPGALEGKRLSVQTLLEVCAAENASAAARSNPMRCPSI